MASVYNTATFLCDGLIQYPVDNRTINILRRRISQKIQFHKFIPKCCFELDVFVLHIILADMNYTSGGGGVLCRRDSYDT